MVKRMWVVPVNSERNMAAGQIVSAGRGLGWLVAESTLREAIVEATKWAAAAGGAVCIAGSLFLAGEVLAMREDLT